MITTQELHEALILDNLFQRYNSDKIYTYIGPMIISVNPFKKLSIYGDSVIPSYETKSRESLPPHLYAIAHAAYRSLVETGDSQSLIISGESGAGKTEATKYILQFLSHVTADPKQTEIDGLSTRILATNPILEAFGNAKTQRNDNSSRFGKFIKIALTNQGVYQGSSIKSYLLEKTRVVHQAPHERNYHVFYQLLKGTSPIEKEKYKLLNSPNDYLYLQEGDLNLKLVDDAQDFSRLKKSFEKLGIPETEVSNYFMVLSGILLLGNIEFDGDDDKTRIKNQELLDTLAALWQVDRTLLEHTLTTKKFQSVHEVLTLPLNHVQAVENRDALAKALYSRLFSHLVKRLNKCIRTRANLKESKFIGVLDIYGFENFERNSLEQFCINYANEKLHHQFIEHMFKAEQLEYENEGVTWVPVDYVDNSACINLIEKQTGILAMMEEEAKMPKGNDETLLMKMVKRHKLAKSFEHEDSDGSSFGVRHYAATVRYDVDGFMDKNKDTLNEDVVQLMIQSHSPLVSTLFELAQPSRTTTPLPSPRGGPSGEIHSDSDSPPYRGISRTQSFQLRRTPTGNSSRNKITVCRKFENDLQKLIKILSSSERHYIRCIKPNDHSMPDEFDRAKVLTQLRSNGVFETVKIRKAGFNRRMGFHAFSKRYFTIGCPHGRGDTISEFLTGYPDSLSKEWAVGKNQVFLREKMIQRLENERNGVIMRHVAVLQRHIRAFNGRRKLANLEKQQQEKIQRITVFQKYVRRWNSGNVLLKILEEHYNKRHLASIQLQQHIRRWNGFQDFLTLKWKQGENDNISIIQRYVRMFLAKKELVHLQCLRATQLEEARAKNAEEERLRRLAEAELRIRQMELAAEERRQHLMELELKGQEEARKRKEEQHCIQQKEDEDRRKQLEEQHLRQVEEEAQQRRRQYDEERQRRDEDNLKRLMEAEMRVRKLEGDAAKRQLEEEEQKKKYEEEYRKRRLEEEEQNRRAEEEHKKRLEEIDEKLRKFDQEAIKRRIEEQQRHSAWWEEEMKKHQEFERKRREEEHKQWMLEDQLYRKKELAEEELQRRKWQEQERNQRDEEEKKHEEQRCRWEDSRIKREEEERKRRAEEERILREAEDLRRRDWLEDEHRKIESEYRKRETQWNTKQEELRKLIEETQQLYTAEKSAQQHATKLAKHELASIQHQVNNQHEWENRFQKTEKNWEKYQEMHPHSGTTITVEGSTNFLRLAGWGILFGGIGIGLGAVSWGVARFFPDSNSNSTSGRFFPRGGQ